MKKKLTEEQLNKVIELYQSGMSINKMKDELHISSTILSRELKAAGIEVIKNRPGYTKEDIEFLREYYPVGDWDKIFERFKGYKKDTIIHIASKYKIRSDTFWSEEDIQIIKDNMYKLSWRKIKPLLNSKRSCQSIQTFAFKRLGYVSNCEWTEKDIEFLRNNYDKMTIDGLCIALPNHPRSSIYSQAFKLGLKTKERILWTDKEVEFLKNNYMKMSNEELASHLPGRTATAIQAKLGNLSLYRNRLEESEILFNKWKRYLRGWIRIWIFDIYERDGHKCVFTGNTEIAAHHIIGFDILVGDFLEKNNYENINVEELSTEEKKRIGKDFKMYHNEYAKGITISKNVHRIYHQIYGRNNANEKDFQEFTKKVSKKEILIR